MWHTYLILTLFKKYTNSQEYRGSFSPNSLSFPTTATVRVSEENFELYGESPMAVAVASMTASLISKLSLRQEDKPVDPSNLKCQGKGFVAPRFYLVGKLNSTRVVQFDSFCSAVCACDMEVVCSS